MSGIVMVLTQKLGTLCIYLYVCWFVSRIREKLLKVDFTEIFMEG